MSAMLQLAWRDVRMDLGSVGQERYAEALAAKVTAYEWIRSDDEFLMSFRSVCLHLGIEDMRHAREVILQGVVLPDEPVPQEALADYEWKPGQNREDRIYAKRKPRALPSVPDVPRPNCPELDPELNAPNTPFTLDALMTGVNVTREAADEAAASWVQAAAEADEEDG